MRLATEQLAGLPLFASLDRAQIAMFNELADLARVGPNEILFQHDETPRELNILLDGFVVETRGHRSGDAFTDVIAPARPIGLAPATLGIPSPTGAKTITSARLVVIPAPELRAMMRADPGLAAPFLDHALTILNEQALVLSDLKLKSSVQRLAAYLLGLVDDAEVSPARFVLPYEKRYLAARIGCSQENLSRAFAALRRIGIETKSSIVVIRDVIALKAFAGEPPNEEQQSRVGSNLRPRVT